MKVRELIELLKEQNPENDVMSYDCNEEGGGIIRRLGTNSKANKDTWEYFKSDHPYSYKADKLSDELTILYS